MPASLPGVLKELGLNAPQLGWLTKKQENVLLHLNEPGDGDVEPRLYVQQGTERHGKRLVPYRRASLSNSTSSPGWPTFIDFDSLIRQRFVEIDDELPGRPSTTLVYRISDQGRDMLVRIRMRVEVVALLKREVPRVREQIRAEIRAASKS